MIILAGFVTFLAGIGTYLVFAYNEGRSPLVGRHVITLLWLLAALCWGIAVAQAHDHGRTDPNWEQMSPEERRWIRGLMQPDNPGYSCCGEADQYWCDGIKVDGDGVFCQITDDRDDKQFNRPHVPLGTWIEIPPNKLKWDKGNPTGHAILFMNASRMVLCFVQNGGV